MPTLTFTRSGRVVSSEIPSLTYEAATAITGSSWTKIAETIANGTDTQVNVAIDVSAVKFFRIYSSTAATIQTNDGTTPDDTLSLLAGHAYEWYATDYAAFLLTADVTKIYVTNAASTDLTIEVLQDSTP